MARVWSAVDSSGNSNTGTLENHSGTASWTASGTINGALVFANNGSVGIQGNPASLRITGSLTMSAWVKFSSFNGANDDKIIEKGESTLIGYQLGGTADCSGNGSIHNLGLVVSSNGTNWIERCSNTQLQTGVWYFLSGVYNASAQTMDVYINGVADNNATFASSGGLVSPPASIFNSTSYVETGIGNGTLLNATVDDLRIYNRALTAAEVLRLYTATGGP